MNWKVSNSCVHIAEDTATTRHVLVVYINSRNPVFGGSQNFQNMKRSSSVDFFETRRNEQQFSTPILPIKELTNEPGATKHNDALALISEWEKTNPEEAIEEWSIIKMELEKDRLSDRNLFDDQNRSS